MFTLPNCLSLFRIATAPLMLLAAWHDRQGLFLGLFIAALLSDALDGFLARALGQTTALGGLLDSWGDFAIYTTVPLAVWWLWPALVRRELLFVSLVVGSFLLPVSVGFVKFRRLTSYHTWGAKFAAACLGLATPLMLLDGPSWPFRLAVILLGLSALDELAITAIMPSWHANIPTCWHAWRLRQQGF